MSILNIQLVGIRLSESPISTSILEIDGVTDAFLGVRMDSYMVIAKYFSRGVKLTV